VVNVQRKNKKKDKDPVKEVNLSDFEENERITLGIKVGNPGKCMLVKSAYEINILEEQKNIPGVNIPITEEEKTLVKNKFKELYFKIIRFNLNRTHAMAVCINFAQMIPFDGFYQPLNIPEQFTEITNIQPYAVGCLVIIRRLRNFLDPPPQGVVADDTYNKQTMNGSLGVIVSERENDRYKILILAPDYKVEQFKNKHANESATPNELKDYNHKYNVSLFYLSKRQLISIKGENLELV
jgi:hypothetical protein